MKSSKVRFLSSSALAMLGLLAAGGSMAQSVSPSAVPPGPEYGRVISSTAIQTAVSVPKQVCGTEQVVTQTPKSGAGAAMGAIAGGAIGNSMGHGSGRALATAVGIVGGAILGEKVEGSPTTQTQQVERCINQQVTEYRTTGYSVVYEYAGRQYSVQLPQDPGPWIKLQITPVVNQPVLQSPVSPQSSVISPSPVTATGPMVISGQTTVVRTVVAEPAVVMVAPPTYPVYVSAPLVLGTSVVYGRGNHRHVHGHAAPAATVGVNLQYGQARRWY